MARLGFAGGLLRVLLIVLAFPAFAPASALDTDRRLDQFRHTRWTLGDGAPGNIRAIAQGIDGFLWLGTSTGLYRFDGIRFERVLPEDDDRVRSLQVTALLATRTGDLWVGYDFGGIGLLRNGHLRSANPSKPSGGVYRIVEGADGAIWVASDGNGRILLSRYLRGRWSKFGAGQGVTGVQFGLPFAQPDGSVYLLAPSTPELSSMPLRRERGTDRFAPWPIRLGMFADMAGDRQGRLWLADNLGVRRVDGTSHEVVPLSGVTTPHLQRQVVFDRDGAMWIAGQDDGIVRVVFRNGKVVGAPDRYAERDGLTGPIAMTAIEDKEGNIWVGTESGLDRFSASNVVQPRKTDALVTGFVGGKQSKQVFFSSIAGVYRMARGMENPELIYPKPSLGVLCGDDRRLLAISMDNNTLLTLTPTGKVRSAKDVGGPLLITCTLDRAGDFWAAIDRVYRLKGTRLQLSDARWTAGEHAGNLAHLRADQKGGLIAGRSLEGVQRIEGDRALQLWRARDGVIGATNLLLPIGSQVFQGAQKGLGLFDGRRHLQLTERLYPFLAGITGIHIANDGSTWLIGANGIYRVKTADLKAAFRDPGRELKFRRFGYEEGFRARSNTLDTNDVVEDSTGRIWFATNRGLAWIDRDHIAQNRLPPSIAILALSSGGRRITSIDAPIRLPVGTERVQIEYTALSLTDSRSNRYRYRLVGADQNWIDGGGSREALYTNLGPGTYRFQVVGSNNDGVWSRRGAALTFEIAPAFYQTRWFLVACLVVFALVLWLLYRWRLSALASRTRGQYDARLAERERIARELHDTLLQGFQGVVLRFQSVAHQLAPESKAHAALESALERADHVLVEGRDRVRELRNDLEPVDLAATLTETLEHVVPDTLRWRVARNGDERKTPAAVADEINQIVAEAAANAARHSGARHLDVEVRFATDRLIVAIADDGRGISPEIRETGRREGHYGLLGMRERAAQLAGSLEFGTRSPSGTLIRLIVPARVAYPSEK